MRVRIIMCFLVLFTAVMSYADTWQGDSDTSWYNSDLREFQIMNAAQFKGLADLVNNEGLTFEDCEVYLMSDIDLNNIQWYPIGYGHTYFGGTEFKGKFIGNNHSINGLLIDCRELPYVSSTGIGLFGNCLGDLSDLQLSGIINVNHDYYYNSSATYIGGLCGDSKGKIKSCCCDIVINIAESNSFMSIGLAAGKTQSIQNVKVNGRISTSNSIQAGIGGLCHRAEEVDQCCVDAEIDLLLTSSSNSTTIGGIVGYATQITNSIFKGSFNLYGYGQLRDWIIGGIAGSAGVIKNSIFAPKSANLNITYDPSWMYGNFVGSICSPMMASDSVIENCYLSDNLNTTPKNGYEVTRDYLCSGAVLDGYSPDIWLFKEGSLPALKSLMATYVVQSVVNNGYVGFEVKEGDSLNYVITPESGWRVYRFYLNDQDYTDSLIQNRYRFENIDRNYQIKVIFEKGEDNAVRVIGADKTNKISIQNNTVTLEGVRVGQSIVVVSQDGMIESRMTAKEPTVIFEISKGVHIINVDERSYKVMN